MHSRLVHLIIQPFGRSALTLHTMQRQHVQVETTSPTLPTTKLADQLSDSYRTCNCSRHGTKAEDPLTQHSGTVHQDLQLIMQDTT